MGKRKKSSRAPTGPKKKEPLATTFQCLFCNHENSVICKLDKKVGIGQLNCKVCGQSFQTNVGSLSAPVDIYADWIDACDDVAKEAEKGQLDDAGPSQAQTLRTSAPSQQKAVHKDDRYENDFVVDDEGGMEEDYAPGR
ncbi:MAG: hypothetical protein M1828_000393 [Chrysothrix sp. TS-e1954]|nr:MAG: hypothetical protein M1828_000393 [Chrysothrix sp. TS-e1954]